MTALVASVFVAALLGSPHCAGMCGGLACVVAGGSGSRRSATAAYNGGRLASYIVIGGLAGMAGAGFDHMGELAGISRPAAIVAGILMVIWGGGSALAAGGVRMPSMRVPDAARDTLARGLRLVASRSPAQRGLVLGLLTPLLPCGWLYAFVTAAAAAGSPARGAIVMAAFWTGTLPVMAMLGLALQRAAGPMRTRLPALTGAALVVIGLLTIVGKFSASPTAMAHAYPSAPAGADGHTPRR